MTIYNGWTIDTKCDFAAKVKLKNPDDTYQDITGWTGKMAVADPSGTLVVHTTDFTVTNNGTQMTFALAHAFTAGLTPMVGHYDLTMTDTGGTIVKRLNGSLEIERTISQ